MLYKPIPAMQNSPFLQTAHAHPPIRNIYTNPTYTHSSTPAQKRLPARLPHLYTFLQSIVTAPSLEPLKRTIPFLPRLLRVDVYLPLIFAVSLKAAVVIRAAQLGNDGPVMAAREHVIPVHRGEKGVRLYVCGAAGEVAEAVGAVDCAERQDEVLCVARDRGFVRGKGDGLVDYSGVD